MGISDQFMSLLLRIFKDKAEQLMLARPGSTELEVSEVSVSMEDVVRHIERSDVLDMHAAREFMGSERFKQNFYLEGQQIFRVVKHSFTGHRFASFVRLRTAQALNPFIAKIDS